ncbi:MAG: YqgE/AlgH family protein [Caulobacteraceae bacterium]|nr:YqgE/AlgH family protein [Caulobacteraceae bacterium]
MSSSPDQSPTGPDEGEFLNGKLLIAMPGIGDPRFERAVILVCLHAPEQAMGVRINAPHEDMTLDAILDKLGIEGRARNARQAVLKGGPVERDRGYVIHSDDYEVDGSTLQVAEGLCLTATRDILETLTEGHELPRRAVLALGYAGWGAGQLELELRENVWLTAPADPDLIFDPDHETKWDRALARIGVHPAMLSGEAGRA